MKPRRSAHGAAKNVVGPTAPCGEKVPEGTQRSRMLGRPFSRTVGRAVPQEGGGMCQSNMTAL